MKFKLLVDSHVCKIANPCTSSFNLYMQRFGSIHLRPESAYIVKFVPIMEFKSPSHL